MSNINIPSEKLEEWNLSNYLIDSVVGKASGSTEQECLYNYPRDVYFVGNLRPIDPEEDSLNKRDFVRKLSPSAFGAEFKVNSDRNLITIFVELAWECYYRALPSYKQQIKWSKILLKEDELTPPTNSSNKFVSSDDETPDETLKLSARDRQQERRPREELFIRFKKIKFSAKGKIICKKTAQSWEINADEFVNDVQNVITQGSDYILQDSERLRLKSADSLFTFPSDVLEMATAYENHLKTLKVEVVPSWKWDINVEIKPIDKSSDYSTVLIQFINISPYNANDKIIEPYFFNPAAKIRFDEEIVVPFELELAPKNFRFDRNFEAKGFNCGVNKQDKKTYLTTHTPIFKQDRYKTKDTPEAKFEKLSNDPIPTLEDILSSMMQYLKTWDNQEKSFEKEYGDNWKEYKSEFLNDKRIFEEEISRFKNGLDLIKNDADIRLAFSLTNASFCQAGLDKNGVVKKDRWRLFQIVFIVTQIPSVASLDPKHKKYVGEREMVDIVYFPTGGGKTEAYLGVLVFHCFFDRLRKKTAGVTCWLRFPLRLLTLQQTQRLADIIGIAELIRRDQKDPRLKGKGIHPFSVGYYVGSTSTPNKIPDSRNPSELSKAQDPVERQSWKRVVYCPSCKTDSITVEFDEKKFKIIHKCLNPTCKFSNGELPVFIVDNEIYRYLPSVIVGTIDKLASIGQQRNLSLVFGKVDGYCKDHGFYNSRCCQENCNDLKKLTPEILEGISGPTLFLQDELHLLKEGLGTFDSHYETFAQFLLKYNGTTHLPLKIIASSATIEKYERQVEHLYGRSSKTARVFPGPGPTLRSSFYAETETYPQRIFVGIIPHNKTIFNSVLEIIEYYHKTTQSLSTLKEKTNPYRGSAVPDTPEWIELLNYYTTSLSYFLATRELDSMRTDIDSHVNHVKLINEGFEPLDISQLTGSTSTDEVSKTLEKLEKFHDRNDPHETVLATNMISHGVDIDRFNCMIFYGIPRQNAEYIQASSRVGRSHVGIVFNCFHPIRERDQSHYSYFEKYHEFLGQLVEPVAINRWSTYGINRTLPGLFMATILQILANRDTKSNRQSYYMLKKISELYTSGEIDKNEIKSILKEAYYADIKDNPNNKLFEEKIDEIIEYYFDNITHPGVTDNFVSKALYPRPMTSLRDVDEPIEIVLDYLGTQWAATS